MRIANVGGRLTLLAPANGAATSAWHGVDVHRASAGRFASDPQAVFARWDEFRTWAERVGLRAAPDVDVAEGLLGPPVPSPAQVLAIGLNYREHSAEAGLEPPASPPTFTKFPSCLAGPFDPVRLPSDHVDWEVELVVAIGRRAYEVEEADAWAHVAGLMVGQDLSERRVQMAGPAPQFSLGKSFPGVGPVGPALVTPDELVDPDDVALGCSVNGEPVQSGRTSQMIFSVAELIARLSAVLPLLPGDLIFTGTPAGVGAARVPPRFLRPGDLLVSHVEGIGELRTQLVGAADRPVPLPSAATGDAIAPPV
jgi:2-keto-4-pentenoate hydratase/2-oxohepta-3-ene-1,7-dioic acid hydratase in catechol pathway